MDRETLTPWLAAAGGALLGLWLGVSPMVQALLVLMGIDVATGLLAGLGALSSRTMADGLRRKAVCLLVILAVHVLGTMANLDGLPAAGILAGFYCAREALSILENARRVGVPIPQLLAQLLARAAVEVENASPESPTTDPDSTAPTPKAKR